MIYALALTGPTASGKTELSVKLAKELGCEIISSDSMQIYKGMDIGTAKATVEEQSLVPHHLLDFLLPTENYSTEAYRNDALSKANDIMSRGKLPLFVGGTGLYLDTLMRAPQPDVPKSESKEDITSRAQLISESEKKRLWERLYKVDPESAEQIHMNNVRRVKRALEIYDTTGKPKSYFDKMSRIESSDIKIGMITLDFNNREALYDRVNKRVDIMMGKGLLDEVRTLLGNGLLLKNTTAAQAIGYKELIRHIEGETTLSEAVELIKLSSRRYAKRQLTWFRHVDGAYRLYVDDADGNIRSMSDICKEALNAAEKLIEYIIIKE